MPALLPSRRFSSSSSFSSSHFYLPFLSLLRTVALFCHQGPLRTNNQMWKCASYTHTHTHLSFSPFLLLSFPPSSYALLSHLISLRFWPCVYVNQCDGCVCCTYTVGYLYLHDNIILLQSYANWLFLLCHRLYPTECSRIFLRCSTFRGCHMQRFLYLRYIQIFLICNESCIFI